MRVAFFVSHFPLVSETFILNMAKGVIDAGHELDIFALWGPPPQDSVLHPIITRYRLMDRYAEPDIPANKLLRLAAVPRTLGRSCATHGLRALRTVPPLNWRRRALNLRLLFESAMLRHGGYDVLHCQFASLAPMVLDHLDIRTLRGRLVVHIRGYDITQGLPEVGPDSYRRVFARADWFLANSDHFRRAAVAAGCPDDRIEVMISGLDLDAFAFRQRPPPADGPVRVVAIGRLVEKKGFAYALQAIAGLRAEGRDVVLDLVGNGPLRADLAREAADAGLAPYVRFHGACPSDEVARILAAGHLFVAPSVTAAGGDQDAATNTVKEAMATGLPVVASRHGGLPEMVLDGTTGLLVPERDADALAAALARLIDTPSLWPALTAAARAKVEGLADNAVVNAQVLALYDKLAGRDAAAAD